MKITPNSLYINQLLSAQNEQFHVPAYQRRYAWRSKQHRELFDDIRLLDDSETHLLGTILLLAEAHTAGVNRLELVDGQQRMTTITLLLSALRNRFNEAGDQDIAKEVDTLLQCKALDRKVRPKLLLGDLDNPDLELLLGSDEDKVTNLSLAEAHTNFKNWLSELSKQDLAVFYYKLLNSCLVIRLDVANAKDAYKLFETINNRGLKLSPTDIIKNFLLGHASSQSASTLKQVKDNWRSVIVSLDQISSDDFFRHNLIGIIGRRVPMSKLVTEFKGHYLRTVKEAEQLKEYKALEMPNLEEGEEEDFVDKNSNENNIHTKKSKKVDKITLTQFTRQLRDGAATYQKLINKQFESKQVNRHLLNLERIQSYPSYIFLLSLFQRDLDEKTICGILRMIESFMMRRHICEYRTGELDDIFARLVAIPTNDIQGLVRAELLKDMPTNENFREQFSKYKFESRLVDRARYALEIIEYRKIKHQGEYYLADASAVHLEHIIPQTIDTKKAKEEFGDWPTYLGNSWKENHPIYVNRIGNLTLLAAPLNIAASNNPFLAKHKEYKKSNLTIAKELSEKYKVFKFGNVDARSEELAEMASEIWRL